MARTERASWCMLVRRAAASCGGAVFSAVLLASAADAAQVLDVRDGDTSIVRISMRDQTRLRVERGRITDVLGDLFDASANPTGLLSLVRDDADGEVYIKPVLPVPARAGEGIGPVRPMKLDIKSDRGTFALLLQPADVVGDTLVLRPLAGAAPTSGTARRTPSSAHSSGAVRAIKAMVLALANPVLADELSGRILPGGGREIALWEEARLVLKAEYAGSDLVGESYELTNVSQQPLVVDEREFYRDGVLAVSLLHLVLPPGHSTPVWIVRQAAPD